MSTGSEDPPKQGTKLHLNETIQSADSEFRSLSQLQEQLEECRRKRKEERFAWFIGTISMFDAFIFVHYKTWTGPLMIVVVQFFLIIFLARRWGIDFVWTITEKLIDKWNGSAK